MPDSNVREGDAMSIWPEKIRPYREAELRRIYYRLQRANGGTGRLRSWLCAYRVARRDWARYGS